MHHIEFIIRNFTIGKFQAQMCTWAPREMCRNVYSIIIYNSLKLETARMSINRKMDKYITAQSHNGDYSTTKMNKLPLYKAWMELRNLHKRSQDTPPPQKKEHIVCFQVYKAQKQAKLNYSDQESIISSKTTKQESKRHNSEIGVTLEKERFIIRNDSQGASGVLAMIFCFMQIVITRV